MIHRGELTWSYVRLAMASVYGYGCGVIAVRRRCAFYTRAVTRNHAVVYSYRRDLEMLHILT